MLGICNMVFALASWGKCGHFQVKSCVVLEKVWSLLIVKLCGSEKKWYFVVEKLCGFETNVVVCS